MAQEKINKAILTALEFLGTQPVILPKDIEQDPYYITRYRIVSEDKTRVSDWSNFYSVTLPTPTSPISNLKATFSKSGSDFSTVTLSWKLAADSPFYAFDIFSTWNKNPHTSITDEYSGTTYGTSISFPISLVNGEVPSSATFKILVNSINGIYDSRLLVISTGQVSVT
jgi:hypothetical protein